MPHPPRSSYTGCATMMSPGALPRSAAAAWVWMASGPLMSMAPRPCRCPSAMTPSKGGCSHSAGSPAATMSRWALSMTLPPEPPRTTPTTLPSSSIQASS